MFLRSYKYSLIFFVFLFFSHFSLAQEDGYKIKVTITGISDSVCFLASYLGDKTYLKDTAVVDQNGMMVFEGRESLPGGLYIVAGTEKNKYFEFLINEKQRFSIETKKDDIAWNIKIKGSTENDLFFNYIAFISSKQEELMPWQSKLNQQQLTSDSIAIIREHISRIDKEVKKFRERFINENQGTFVAAFLQATMDPVIPDPSSLSEEITDSAFAYRYYKQHYWDNLDLADARLLRTPLFHKKLEKYLNEVVLQIPDTLNKEIDYLLEAAQPSKEVFEYLLWHMTIKYESSKIMGFDAIFVHLANMYFKTGQADWLNETVTENIINRANILEPLLIGKKAPNMILLDTNNIPTALHSVQAKYILIFFWDTDCSFCKKETPKLKKFYREKGEKHDIEVFAVCIDTSMSKWKQYIYQHDLHWINVNGYLSMTPDFHDLYDVHSSPVMYLLDKDKNILTKRILIDQIIEYIYKMESIRE